MAVDINMSIIVIREAPTDANDPTRISNICQTLLSKVVESVNGFALGRIFTGSGSILTAQFLDAKLHLGFDNLASGFGNSEPRADLRYFLEGLREAGNVILVVSEAALKGSKVEAAELPLGIRVYDGASQQFDSQQTAEIAECFKTKPKPTSPEKLQAIFAAHFKLVPDEAELKRWLPADDPSSRAAMDAEHRNLTDNLTREVQELKRQLDFLAR
jgi:hypothetical protein